VADIRNDRRERVCGVERRLHGGGDDLALFGFQSLGLLGRQLLDALIENHALLERALKAASCSRATS
jgi:hypothetical protein